jgi:hypothetical protein
MSSIFFVLSETIISLDEKCLQVLAGFSVINCLELYLIIAAGTMNQQLQNLIVETIHY